MTEKNPMEAGSSEALKQEEERKIKAEKLYSEIVQWLGDTSEYTKDDIPTSRDKVIEIIRAMYKDYGVKESIPQDDIIEKLYPLFLEDWEGYRKESAGFDEDEDWPDPSEWPEDIVIEDPYPDFEVWKKAKIEEMPRDLKEESAEQPMSLHDFLELLKREMISILSKIDEVGLTDEQKRYLGIKKSFMWLSGIKISRGLDFGSAPYTEPKVEIDERLFSDKGGLKKLEETLNMDFKISHFDDFWERAEGLEEPLFKKIKEACNQIKFKPIDLPQVKDSWLKIKEHKDRENKRNEEMIEERARRRKELSESKEAREKQEKERIERECAENKRRLIQEILEKRGRK